MLAWIFDYGHHSLFWDYQVAPILGRDLPLGFPCLFCSVPEVEAIAVSELVNAAEHEVSFG